MPPSLAEALRTEAYHRSLAHNASQLPGYEHVREHHLALAHRWKLAAQRIAAGAVKCAG